MWRTVFFFFSLYLPFSVFAQVADLTWHPLGLKEGLAEATNAFVHKDSRGFVWIGSLSGLSRFDGTSVKVYKSDKSDPSTLLDDNIQSPFFEDTEHAIWFTTYEGIHRYNFESDCFDHYQVFKLDTQAIKQDTQVSKQDTQAIKQDTLTTEQDSQVIRVPRIGYYIFHLDPDQYLWFLVEFRFVYTMHIPTGAISYKGGINLNSIRGFPITDDEGYVKQILFRGRSKVGIDAVDVNSERAISEKYLYGDDDLLKVQNFKQALQDRNSVLWILHSQALVHYDTSTRISKSYPLAEGQEGMIRYNDTLLVIGTQISGLKVFNTRLHQFVEMKGLTGPVNANQKLQKIKYITRDKEGVVWLSIDGVGIYYAQPAKKKFNFIRFSDYLEKNSEIKPVQLFEHKPGELLCFTESDGVLLIEVNGTNIQVSPYSPLEKSNLNGINSVVRDAHGRYWISTWKGLFIFNPEAKPDLVNLKGTTSVFGSLFAIPAGKIYCTTTEMGLYEVYIENEKPGCTQIPGDFSEKVYISIHGDHKNRIWLNHYVKEFEVYDATTLSYLGGFPCKGIPTSLASSGDGKSVFIGTNIGFYEIEDSTFQIKKVHNPQNGFPATSIFSILNEGKDILWLGHSVGIVSYNTATGKIRSFTTEDALPPTAFTEAACKLSTGQFCFGTIGGISIFYPDSVKDVVDLPIPQITDLQLNNRAPEPGLMCETTGATHFAAMDKLVLPYRYNTISFSIHSLEYSAPAANKLSYQMEGLDPEILEVGNGTRIRYTAMPPGPYRFVVNAYNSDGILNPNPRVLEITIKPPYYMTWWFITLTALTAFSIVGYILYLRFSKKLELQNIRLKLYENLHDDVGSRLTAIVLSAEDLEQNEKITHPKITSIARIARSIVGNMRRLVWAIDPVNDQMMSIVQKINHDKSLILDDDIDFNIEIDDRLKKIIVPGEIRYQISSVCNESFTNIAKYAQATQVIVRIKKENKAIKLVVEDDGIGFDPAEKAKNTLAGSGYGMANMKRRASRAGGEFNVYSSPGKGTRIEFQFPFRA